MSELLQNLNDVQRQAVLHRNGPVVVFAGAGSGKTRIITTRIAYLIETGVLPWEILAVTFTNKAAGEMRERALHMAPETKRTMITTFHSASARWLREFAGELGYEPNYSIYDDQDVTRALKHIVKQLMPKGEIPTIVADMKHFLHHVKTAGVFVSEIEAYAQQYPAQVPTGGVQIYRAYQEFLAQSNAMDFNDLLLNVLLLLRKNERVKSILGARYQYIMVDEFQDTNRTQFEIIQHLAERHQNLMVVGDDDQSIYSWRGATPSNIIDFDRTYPGATRIALEENYRCTGNIVAAASKLVSYNKKRAAKTLFTNAPAGELIEVHLEVDGEMEAHWIAEEIYAARNTYDFEDVAIFYRTNAQSRSLEEALLRRRIPYTLYGSLEFYERLEIKDILAYLRLFANPSDDVSFLRIYNVPTRGLGDKALETLQVFATSRGLSLWKAAEVSVTDPALKGSPKLRYLVDLLKAMRTEILESPINEAVKTVLEATEYPAYLKKKYPDQYADKMDNIQELAAGIIEYEAKNEGASLADWIETVSLVREDAKGQVTKGVSMMTLHMAKGLEFPRVFIAGVEDGLLPHKNSVEDMAAVEEERRLLYVGITRAKSKISLTCAKRRRNFNNEMAHPPSRFFQEIPAELMALSFKAQEALQPEKTPVMVSYEYDEGLEGTIEEGSQVFHPTYGKGTVHGFDVHLGSRKAVVNFRDFGYRKIRPSQLQLRGYALD
ncbi:MAG: ATP-dependent DNA helicase PcrA [Proteobacteria bacterium]|nr:MAG: ATP-dependent DNA helicase PcrA [Pseudomonadota bacterium]